MRYATIVTLFGAALSMFAVSGAGAQDQRAFVNAFAGSWQTLDPASAGGGVCAIELTKDPVENNFDLTTEDCLGLLADAKVWGIVDNQLALLDSSQGVLVRLGGNQRRMSGKSRTGTTLIFERVTPNIAAARTAAPDCIYYGYTATCAGADDLKAPVSPGENAMFPAKILVRLNARAEARPGASVVATIPKDTCVVIDECTTASDGNWCKTSVSNKTAWIVQRAVRLNRWPVVTYKLGCE